MSTPVLTPEQRRDAEFGMAWWNNLTEPERSKWLARADSAVPADAWAEFKESGPQLNERP